LIADVVLAVLGVGFVLLALGVVLIYAIGAAMSDMARTSGSENDEW
jgi:Na+-transporting methylmalonyl-CoA/oxaloacetate decarboxylase gamma subunit